MQLTTETFPEYLDKASDYLSSHALGDFRRSPAILHARRAGEIVWKKSAAFAIGTAAHTLILEGADEYARQYTMDDGPIDPKTGKPYRKNTNKYKAWREDVWNSVISHADDFYVRKMCASVHRHAEAGRLLTGGQAEGVLRGAIEGVECQTRMDYYTAEHGFVDLKTCRNLDDFEQDVSKYGYMYQMAFYHLMLSAHGMPSKCHIVAVEKVAPYRTGVWRCEALPVGAVLRDIIEYGESEKTKTWPTRYEAVRTLRGD